MSGPQETLRTETLAKLGATCGFSSHELRKGLVEGTPELAQPLGHGESGRQRNLGCRPSTECRQVLESQSFQKYR